MRAQKQARTIRLDSTYASLWFFSFSFLGKQLIRSRRVSVREQCRGKKIKIQKIDHATPSRGSKAK